MTALNYLCCSAPPFSHLDLICSSGLNIFADRFTVPLMQQLEDIHVVILHKEEGAGLGFTIAGGIDQNKATTVSKIFTAVLASTTAWLMVHVK